MEIHRKNSRLFTIETNKKVMETPFFFPAVSSIKTNLIIDEYLNIILKIAYPGFLISSYDLYNLNDKDKKKLLNIVSESTDRDTFTLMDSGYYEAYWYHDSEWNIQKLESILSAISVDFCFSFDIFWDKDKNEEQYVKETVTSIAMTAGMQKSGTTIPLLHSNPESFPDVVRKVVEGINPEVVGVPERELGPSIFQRAATVKRIRDELDKTNRDIPLHLLGTGNPRSLLVYTLCGADIYDGLEWCQTVVDPETGYLFHFAQKDLIECDCQACKITDMAYHIQTIVHNLLFYREFTKSIRLLIEENEVGALLNKYFNKKSSEKIKAIMGKQ